MKIIKEEKWQKETYYTLEFIGDPHEFGFPCNKDGKLLKEKMVQAAIDNYNLCINTPERFKIKNLGGDIVKHEIEYKEPAVGKCSCGKKIKMLSHYLGALQCPKCKKWYNVWGQELLPPECWE